MPAPRVVSLIASATEIVSALGFVDALVGVSHECDHPPQVRRLPVCSESKIDVHADSREIDRQVKSILQDAVSVYRVLTDRLDALRPDLIITQAQCEVCAVSLADVEQAVAELVTSRPKVLSLEPNRLQDAWSDIERVADALGAPAAGARFVESATRRLAGISARSAKIGERPRVACIEWIDPLMAAGNWVPELVDIAGGENLLGESGRHSPWMELDDLNRADPDVIICMPCGLDIERTRKELPALTSRSRWQALSAVRGGRVYLADGNQFFNRPGPRLVESAEILAEILHPRTFSFGHSGVGWTRP